MIQEDDGYFFGLGAFETIAVENGTPVLLEKHYARLYQAAVFLGLSLCKEQIEEEVGKKRDENHSLSEKFNGNNQGKYIPNGRL